MSYLSMFANTSVGFILFCIVCSVRLAFSSNYDTKEPSYKCKYPDLYVNLSSVKDKRHHLERSRFLILCLTKGMWRVEICKLNSDPQGQKYENNCMSGGKHARYTYSTKSAE